MARHPIRVTDDLRLIGAETGALRPVQGLALAEVLVRKSLRHAMAEEAGLDRLLSDLGRWKRDSDRRCLQRSKPSGETGSFSLLSK